MFGLLGLIPAARNAKVVEASLSLNYTTILNILFLGVAAVLVVRFLRTGGREMLAMMSSSPSRHDHEHGERHRRRDLSK